MPLLLWMHACSLVMFVRAIIPLPAPDLTSNLPPPPPKKKHHTNTTQAAVAPCFRSVPECDFLLGPLEKPPKAKAPPKERKRCVFSLEFRARS